MKHPAYIEKFVTTLLLEKIYTKNFKNTVVDKHYDISSLYIAFTPLYIS